MTRADVERILIDTFREVLKGTAKGVPDIGHETRPLVDFPDFDSLNCVEVEVMLSERFGHEVEDVLIPSNDPSGILTVRDMVDHLCRILPVESETNE